MSKAPDNFAEVLVVGLPGGVEAQEAQGQARFVEAQQLPVDMSNGDRATLERIGFAFGELVDKLFLECAFPEGWKKVPTEHSMWSELVDPKGRKRGSIFYKAAFYNQRAFMYLRRRFGIETVYGADDINTVCVKDDDKIVHTVGTYDCHEYVAGDALTATGQLWLDERYPQWKDQAAYWD
jgi:hypothetical protein